MRVAPPAALHCAARRGVLGSRARPVGKPVALSNGQGSPCPSRQVCARLVRELGRSGSYQQRLLYLDACATTTWPSPTSRASPAARAHGLALALALALAFTLALALALTLHSCALLLGDDPELVCSLADSVLLGQPPAPRPAQTPSAAPATRRPVFNHQACSRAFFKAQGLLSSWSKRPPALLSCAGPPGRTEDENLPLSTRPG